MVFCTKCGLQQADSSKFCSDCANPITGGAKATPGGPSAPDMNARPPAFSPDSVMGAAGAGGSSAGPPNPGQTPPGCFLVQIPAGMQPGSVVTCQVPPPYPQVTPLASIYGGLFAAFVCSVLWCCASGVAGGRGFQLQWFWQLTQPPRPRRPGNPRPSPCRLSASPGTRDTSTPRCPPGRTLRTTATTTGSAR